MKFEAKAYPGQLTFGAPEADEEPCFYVSVEVRLCRPGSAVAESKTVVYRLAAEEVADLVNESAKESAE